MLNDGQARIYTCIADGKPGASGDVGTKLGILIYVYIIIMIQFTDDAGMRDGEERKRRCLSGEFRIGEKTLYIHTYIYYIVSKSF